MKRGIHRPLLVQSLVAPRFFERGFHGWLELGPRFIGESLFPVGDGVSARVQVVVEIRSRFGEFLLHTLGRFKFIGEFQHATGRGLAMAVFHRVVEEGEKLVILALADGIELVVMTLRAAHGQAEENRAESVHAIHHRFDAELLWVDAALLIDLRVPVESGRNLLRDRGTR